MLMGRRARRAGLTLHVASSVGWLGAVAVAVVLAIVVLTSSDIDRVRAAWLVMPLIGWWVLVPLSLAALATGLAQSLGTPWGLARHYWVLAKLVLNVIATVVLLLFMPTLDTAADAASRATREELAGGLVGDPSPLVHGVAALLLLLLALALSIFKPVGVTPFGARRRCPG